jgi:hypothetical protein
VKSKLNIWQLIICDFASSLCSQRLAYFTDSQLKIIQNVPRGRVSILGGHSIGNSKQKCICTSVIFGTFSEIDLFHCTVLRQDAFRRATCCVLTRVAKYTDVDGGIFENIL